MRILIEDSELNLLLEKKKNFIGRKVAWDSVLSACSFLISVIFASYDNIWVIPGLVFKVIFMIAGIVFTAKAVYDVIKSKKNSYNYEDLLEDINKLNKITHNHSIVAIRDTFNEHANRFLIYDDPVWKCKLFLNYKDNVDNGEFIKTHLSRALKIDAEKIKLKYINQLISEKTSARNNQDKIYCHKLFLANIESFPDYMKNDTFTCDGVTYHWVTIAQLEADPEAMKKNADIIKFVKDSI